MKIDIIHGSEKLSRVTEISLKDKILSTPAYFPSISSYGIKLPLSYLIYLLSNFEYPRLFVSAYDLAHSKGKDANLMSSIEKYNLVVRNKKKGFLFVDSGTYESSWYGDTSWDLEAYRAAIMGMDFDFFSSLDIIPQNAVERDSELIQQTFSNIIISRSFSGKGELVAILHGRSPDHLINVADQFLSAHSNLCRIIGIPERDCGNGVLERAQTIMEIRKIIEAHEGKHILHILGSGDPSYFALFLLRR